MIEIYPKVFFESSKIAIKPRTCFVIMPFGNFNDELYREIIKECLEENYITAIRADELYGSKPIMEDILKNIESSELIIADLSGRNPNVFYELGIAHTRKNDNTVIIISQDINDVPFDLRPYRIIPYTPTISGAKSLKRQLSETLRDFRLKPIEWLEYKWQPSTPNWYKSDTQTLVGEVLSTEGEALIFNRLQVKASKLQISFTAKSNGPEVNLLFYADGIARFSGYHFWFWRGGTKLRRLEDEVKLETGYKLQKNLHHNIQLYYDKGNITAKVDNRIVLEYFDSQPLHEKKGLEFVGFNAWYHKQGSVNFSDFKIHYE